MNTNLLWIHGWGMSSAVWEQDARLHMPDAEHDFFSYSSCSTLQEVRQNLRNVLMNQTKPTTLIGWSMGAMLAIELASDKQLRENINALVIIGGTLRFTTPDRSKGWLPRIVERMKQRLLEQPQETVTQFTASMFAPLEQEQFPVASFAESVRSDFSLQLLGEGLDYLIHADLTNHWHNMHPRDILWIHGSHDPICPVGGMPEMPEANKFVVEAAGHAPFLTRKELFYGHLRRFTHVN